MRSNFITDRNPETGWRQTEMSLTLPFMQRLSAALRLIVHGTFHFSFWWTGAGRGTEIWIDDISLTIGGK